MRTICGTIVVAMSCVTANAREPNYDDASPVASFLTEDIPPRWIRIEGRVGNIRDLGGWKATDGRRVKFDLLFRGEGLNDNSVSGRKEGRNRLMVEDVVYLTRRLGIKTDLDLRSDDEVAGMAASPLGPGVTYVQRSSSAYRGIFESEGKKTMAENFRLFCDRVNYPIYFHCIAGADRTGSLAYVLNGVLGVPKASLEKDWESTFYPDIPGYCNSVRWRKYWRGIRYFDEGFSRYGGKGDSLQRRVELYLLDCGVTQEEIDAFRSIMLEDCAR